jgi:hypothetical protein
MTECCFMFHGKHLVRLEPKLFQLITGTQCNSLPFMQTLQDILTRDYTLPNFGLNTYTSVQNVLFYPPLLREIIHRRCDVNTASEKAMASVITVGYISK